MSNQPTEPGDPTTELPGSATESQGSTTELPGSATDSGSIPAESGSGQATDLPAGPDSSGGPDGVPETTGGSVLSDPADAESETLAEGEKTGGARRRLAGLLATLLSLVGILASLAAAVLSLTVIFGASDTAAKAMEPVDGAVDRLETRIDQTDDRIGLQGVADQDLSELVARTNGLSDVADGAVEVFTAVDQHPIYRYLPAGLGELGDDLAVYAKTASEVDESVMAATSLTAEPAAELGGKIDELQARVTNTRTLADEAESSLTRWIRIAGLGGLVLGLWSLWGQLALFRRGRRGLLGRDL